MFSDNGGFEENLGPLACLVITTMKEHWEGILNWFDSHISNGILEGFNSLILSAKARARGYRINRILITIAYLIAGNLDYGLPTSNSEEPKIFLYKGLIDCGHEAAKPITTESKVWKYFYTV
jgi:hypothetical protein